MGTTSIEWTTRTWNPLRGCSVVSPGCHNCYARTIAARFSDPGRPFHGFAERTEHGPQWTGRVSLVVEHLADPLRWREPSRVFVNSMSDLFHEELPDEDIAAIFGVMAAAPQHTFQVLTKRAGRMREWFEKLQRNRRGVERIGYCLCYAQARSEHRALRDTTRIFRRPWPLPNVWLGVSTEDQKRADERIPDLLMTPAAVRFVSYEPALGPVDFAVWIEPSSHCRACGEWHDRHIGGDCPACKTDNLITVWGAEQREQEVVGTWTDRGPDLHWIIAGSESGHGARPFEEAWARYARDQCEAAGVPFFYKQAPGKRPGSKVSLPLLDGRQWAEFPATG